MTKREIVKILKNEVACLRFNGACDDYKTCEECPLFTKSKKLIKALEETISIIEMKDLCEDDGK